jgi:hypothetical protein
MPRLSIEEGVPTIGHEDGLPAPPESDGLILRSQIIAHRPPLPGQASAYGYVIVTAPVMKAWKMQWYGKHRRE